MKKEPTDAAEIYVGVGIVLLLTAAWWLPIAWALLVEVPLYWLGQLI